MDDVPEVTVDLDCEEAHDGLEGLRWKVAMLDVASAVPIEWEP